MVGQERELADKVAIVTGSARNIGRATALELAEGGASLVINARTSKDLCEEVAHEIESSGGRALPFVTDITDERILAGISPEGTPRCSRHERIFTFATTEFDGDIIQARRIEKVVAFAAIGNDVGYSGVGKIPVIKLNIHRTPGTAEDECFTAVVGIEICALIGTWTAVYIQD